MLGKRVGMGVRKGQSHGRDLCEWGRFGGWLAFGDLFCMMMKGGREGRTK